MKEGGRSDFNVEKWDSRYLARNTPWDIGYASPVLMHFARNQISKTATVLLPGAGNAWEAEKLHQMGYSDIYVCDWSPTAMEAFASRVQDFPEDHLYLGDFFQLDITCDFILEQTFFCSMPRDLRPDYVQKCQELLQPSGILAGVLFNVEFEKDGPPFGGSIEEYTDLFSPHFNIMELAPTTQSIRPRLGKECKVVLKAKTKAGRSN